MDKQFLIQGSTLEESANKIRDKLEINKYAFKEDLIDGNNGLTQEITVYYTKFIDSAQGYQDQEDNPDLNFVSYDYAVGPSGEIVPALLDDFYNSESADYHYYEGIETINGVQYDKWRKINEPYYPFGENVPQCYKYTDLIVNHNAFSPVDFPQKIEEVYQKGVSENKPVLFGSYLLKKQPEDCPLAGSLPDLDVENKGVYGYFGEGSEGYYERGLMTINPTYFTTGYGDILSLYTNSVPYYWEYQGEKLPEADDEYRIIEFRNPLEVTQEFYDGFLMMVEQGENSETPYLIGKEVGEKNAVGIDWIEKWDEMLGDVDTEVTGGYRYDEETGNDYYHAVTGVLLRESSSGKMWHIPSGAIVDDPTLDLPDLIVVPRGITNIRESTIEAIYDWYGPVICLPTTPPSMGWQGAWSADGGNMPPSAIYVPDNSVNAYKAHQDWAEYSYIIKPLSEFNYDTAWG